MPERERPQERPQRRGRHHPERQHLAGRPRSKLVGVIDVRAASKDRRDQRQHLASRPSTTDTAQSHRSIHRRFDAETPHQRRRHDQPGVSDKRLIVEGRLDAVDHARYSTH